MRGSQKEQMHQDAGKEVWVNHGGRDDDSGIYS